MQRIGSHKWVPSIDCNNVGDLTIDEKMERYLNYINRYNDDYINVYLFEQVNEVVKEGLLEFDESDLLRNFTTTDDFDMKIYINDHEFKLSSKLYWLLEQNFHLNLHYSVYRVTL